MARHSVLLIISGSIAAHKSLDLIRRLTERDIGVRAILTRGGEQFVSRKDVQAAGATLYTELFSSDEDIAMAHIHLSRQSELVVVAPASADIIAKMVHGFADDLASATLLASDKQLVIAPAMNTRMWEHPATQRNIAQIKKDGAHIIEPAEGMLACGEIGAGRMAEPEEILKAIESSLRAEQSNPGLDRHGASRLAMTGIKALITSGPTQEAIDPVRYIGNRSSGKQGHAIAAALARKGALVTLVAGPTALPDPSGVSVVRVTSAAQMWKACERALPVDVAVCAAAVGDWRAESVAVRKLKKQSGTAALSLVENIDILQAIAMHPKKRPALVVGFAAETENLLKNAQGKLRRKGADWIVANDVSGGKTFGAEDNEITLVTAKGHEEWPHMSKDAVAEKLVEKITRHLAGKKS